MLTALLTLMQSAFDSIRLEKTAKIPSVESLVTQLIINQTLSLHIKNSDGEQRSFFFELNPTQSNPRKSVLSMYAEGEVEPLRCIIIKKAMLHETLKKYLGVLHEKIESIDEIAQKDHNMSVQTLLVQGKDHGWIYENNNVIHCSRYYEGLDGYFTLKGKHRYTMLATYLKATNFLYTPSPTFNQALVIFLGVSALFLRELNSNLNETASTELSTPIAPDILSFSDVSSWESPSVAHAALCTVMLSPLTSTLSNPMRSFVNGALCVTPNLIFSTEASQTWCTFLGGSSSTVGDSVIELSSSLIGLGGYTISSASVGNAVIATINSKTGEPQNVVEVDLGGLDVILGASDDLTGHLWGSGYTKISGFSSPLFLSMNSTGALTSSFKITNLSNGGQITSMARKSNEDVFLAAGITDSPTKGLFIKIATNGTVISSKSLSVLGADSINGVCQTPDGGTVLAGYTGTPIKQGWVTKLDKNDNVLFTRLFSATNGALFNNCASRDDGSIILVGTAGTDGFSVLLSATGDVVKMIAPSAVTLLNVNFEVKNGEQFPIAVGYINGNPASLRDALLLFFNTDGSLITGTQSNAVSFSGSASDIARSVISIDNGLVYTGNSASLVSTGNAFVCRSESHAYLDSSVIPTGFTNLDRNQTLNSQTISYTSASVTMGSLSPIVTPITPTVYRNTITTLWQKSSSNAPTLFPSAFPTSSPSITPTWAPTLMPSTFPTDIPTYTITLLPTCLPTDSPSFTPSEIPTLWPSSLPTNDPSLIPTLMPTFLPSGEPSLLPTLIPSDFPTLNPSEIPTICPSALPTSDPSLTLTLTPIILPSGQPTLVPSLIPSNHPSNLPSMRPSTWPSSLPTNDPSLIPTLMPTFLPSGEPSLLPTLIPSDFPSLNPSEIPTICPSALPTSDPSLTLTLTPIILPSGQPTLVPSLIPSNHPSNLPSMRPSTWPSSLPTNNPSLIPTLMPTFLPSGEPSLLPTLIPSDFPTLNPSEIPTICPSALPTSDPSLTLTLTPIILPSGQPTLVPSLIPSNHPSNLPSMRPSTWPSSLPTNDPSLIPSLIPTILPSGELSLLPTLLPSNFPTLSSSEIPIIWPSELPTDDPSFTLTLLPTITPSGKPSLKPSLIPSELSNIPSWLDPSYSPIQLSTPSPSDWPNSPDEGWSALVGTRNNEYIYDLLTLNKTLIACGSISDAYHINGQSTCFSFDEKNGRLLTTYAMPDWDSWSKTTAIASLDDGYALIAQGMNQGPMAARLNALNQSLSWAFMLPELTAQFTSMTVSKDKQQVIITGYNQDFDMIAFALNSTSGALLWGNTYQRVNAKTYPSAIALIPSSGQLRVIASGGNRMNSKLLPTLFSFLLNPDGQVNTTSRLTRSSSDLVQSNFATSVAIEPLTHDSVIVGSIYHQSTGTDMMIARVNQTALDWAIELRGSRNDRLTHVKIKNHVIFAAGTSSSFNNVADIIVIKLNLQGDILRAVRLGSPQEDSCSSFIFTENGLALGISTQSTYFGNEASDAGILFFDENLDSTRLPPGFSWHEDGVLETLVSQNSDLMFSTGEVLTTTPWFSDHFTMLSKALSFPKIPQLWPIFSTLSPAQAPSINNTIVSRQPSVQPVVRPSRQPESKTPHIYSNSPIKSTLPTLFNQNHITDAPTYNKMSQSPTDATKRSLKPSYQATNRLPLGDEMMPPTHLTLEEKIATDAFFAFFGFVGFALCILKAMYTDWDSGFIALSSGIEKLINTLLSLRDHKTHPVSKAIQDDIEAFLTPPTQSPDTPPSTETGNHPFLDESNEEKVIENQNHMDEPTEVSTYLTDNHIRRLSEEFNRVSNLINNDSDESSTDSIDSSIIRMLQTYYIASSESESESDPALIFLTPH